MHVQRLIMFTSPNLCSELIL